MSADFIELAGRVNVGMPYYAFDRISGALNAGRKPVNGSRILLLGMSYKPNVGDLRESPSLKILDLRNAVRNRLGELPANVEVL